MKVKGIKAKTYTSLGNEENMKKRRFLIMWAKIIES